MGEIIYDKNEANKSINVSTKIDASKKIEQNEIKIIKSGTAKDFITYFDTCLANILEESR